MSAPEVDGVVDPYRGLPPEERYRLRQTLHVREQPCEVIEPEERRVPPVVSRPGPAFGGLQGQRPVTGHRSVPAAATLAGFGNTRMSIQEIPLLLGSQDGDAQNSVLLGLGETAIESPADALDFLGQGQAFPCVGDEFDDGVAFEGPQLDTTRLAGGKSAGDEFTGERKGY